MIFKKVKNRICVASLGVLAGLLLVFCSPIDVHAEGTVLTSKEIKHVHSSANTTPCYTHKACGGHGLKWTTGSETWDCIHCGGTVSGTWKCMSWTDCNGSWHQVGGKENNGVCQNCGAIAHHGSSGGSGTQYCGGKWAFTCTHSNETIGSIAITLEGSELKAQVAGITADGYTWKIGSTQVSTSPSCHISQTGTYTLSVTFKDIYSGKTRTESLSTVITISASVSATPNTWTTEDVLLSTSTIGASPVSFQWYKNGSIISGATNSTYTATEYATYHCHVKFDNGVEVDSNKQIAYIDRTAPTVSITSSPNTSNTQCSKQVVLSVIASDEQSGVGSYQWFKNDTLIAGATIEKLTISKTSDGDTYKCEVSDSVGNVTFVQTLVYVDTDIPEIETETEDLIQNTKVSISLKDIWLSSLEILKETTVIGAWFDIDGKTFDMDYIISENGSYTLKATDSAGNVSTRIIPIAMSGIYGLNQEATLYHIHGGTAGSKTPNGCYTTPYGSTEQVQVSDHSTTYQIPDGQWCDACGSNHCHGGHHPSWTETRACTRYRCSHDQEIVGALTLTKSTNTGEYVLSIDDALTHASIVSYKWTGTESPSTDAFPSVRPNGAKATDVTNKITKSVVIPDFGTYTCVVTYKDGYSGATKAITFRYKVEDFDLEPPTVSLIEDKLYEETLDYDGLKAFNEKVNTDEPFATAYKESTTLTLHLEDNMSLSILKCTSGNLTFEKSLSKSKAETVDITFVKNGKYEFNLYDCINNVYAFTIEIRCIDTDNPVIKTYVTNPSYSKKSAIYTLQVASEDYSKMKYKWLRKDHETGKIEVYKNWCDEPFVNLKDNGSYAVMVADSVYYNASETEPVPTESYLSRGGHKHIVILNKDFNEPRLNYYYCDTEPPKVTYELRPTPRFVIVTIKATDNQDTEDELKYTCDKTVKSDKNLFYVTQNGTYKFTVTDECGNSTTISVYVDFDALTGASPSIIKDLIITPLGKTYVSEGVTYSNTGYTYKPAFKDFVDTNFVLTKWNEKGTYKQVYSYTVSENASDVLYSRYTKDETVNTGEIEYPTNIATKSIDKEAPTLAINVKNKIAYITTSDKISGVGKIEVETMTAHSKNTSYVDYSEKRSTNVTYALPMDYNTIYGIKIFDNVGNEGLQYYVSTDGVLTGGINNLYVVIFVDGDGKQINEQYLIKGANAVAPEAPTKTGCTFTKWSCDYTNVNSNLLVYPVFTSNATGQILDEEIHYDESLRIKLKDSGFMFSNGGDGEIDEGKAERREIDDTVYLQETVSEEDYLFLNENDTPKAFMKQYVYKYAGSSLIIMLLVLLAFKEWNERKRIE